MKTSTNNNQKKTTAKELANLFPMLKKINMIQWETEKARKNTKTERGALARLTARENALQTVFNRGKVKEMHIAMHWTTGGAYGWQCYCSGGYVQFEGGELLWLDETDRHKTTGCGYDKRSTCAADVLNTYMLPNLVAARRRFMIAKGKKQQPYGMSYGDTYKPYLMGGVGIRSLINCLEFMGAQVEYTDQEKADFLTIKF